MPWVEVWGYVTDHRQENVPAELEPRLYFKPNRGRIDGQGALDNVRVWGSLNRETGYFAATIWSDPGDPELWYTLCMDWLPPGQETEPTEERARTYYEWPERIYPDIGGRINDLVRNVVGVGLVYVSTAVSGSMSPVPPYQLLFNPETDDLYQRVITW